MLEIIDINNHLKWDQIVKSFVNWDVYYLSDYAISFQLHGDGEPLLIYYHDENTRFCYVVMKSDIAYSAKFINLLAPKTYYDLETPYGYGGPLTDNLIPKISEEIFYSDLLNYCNSENIVSQFVRFHPLLENQNSLPNVIESKYLRDTIFIDLSSQDQILSNMDGKNRNMIRKAKKNGITIEIEDIAEYSKFIDIYNETMRRDNAQDYYFFHDEYFESLNKLKDNAVIFYALLDGKAIGSSIILYNKKYMHYHLSGTYTEYRKLASGNLLLYEAACWGAKQGIEKFHLGGGLSADDSLFGFKKQFNKNGKRGFYVGRTIFDNKEYEMLKQLRKNTDPDFDLDNGFMIQYRK